MQWDLGNTGLQVLLLMSLAFGLIAQLMMGWAAHRWTWLYATAGYFVLGLVISEVWFGWATEAELQPNIDGLSFDEVLLGLIPGIAAVLLIRHRIRRSRRPLTAPASSRSESESKTTTSAGL